MPVLLHVIDAFASEPFTGNPAAVCLLPTPAPDSWMQKVAGEMNLSETAFLHPDEDGFSLRWFTPTTEVDLCGHATLASAHFLWSTGVLSPEALARFHTRSGLLTCQQEGEWVAMDFPAKPCVPCVPPDGLADALGCEILGCGRNGMDYLAEVRDEASVRSLAPRMELLSRINARGIIATSRSERSGIDFVSRFFAPAAGVPEDPVTGSAHCALGPYWAGKIGGTRFTAYQTSARGGTVRLRLEGDRVILQGTAVTVSHVHLLRGP
jgi:predicted PhzF superfamily epimerase YddE/YHI9